MNLLVHTVSGAPRGWRVLIGLTLKGLPYSVRYLEASEREHKSDAFLALNPRGTVPVLQADALIIPDSLAILAWLDRQFPDQPIFGATANDAALIWRATTSCCDYLRTAIDQLLGPVLVKKITMPVAGSEQMASLKAAGAQLQAECRALDSQLKDQPYLCGDHPSAAEAVAFPEICLIQRAIEQRADIMRAAGFADIGNQFANLTAWLHRVGARKGINKILPKHW